MFSNFTVALLFGIGAGGWIYAKMYRQSGGNTKSALLVSGIAGFGLFLLVLIVMGLFLK
jgi:hypothetical protein